MKRLPLQVLSKRTSGEWWVRGIAAVVAATLGVFSVSDSLANMAAKADLVRAHALAPHDGRVTASLAEQKFELGLESSADSTAARLARLALIQDPTATKALTVLGLQAQLRGDTEQARRLFSYSLQLSRRELQPRVWAIEEAVRRGDIAGALENYDIAMRTSEKSIDLLFPILASAVTEPKVRTALIKTMARKPAWADRFINYLSDNSVDPKAAVLFYREGSLAKLPIDNADRAGIVNALANRGLFQDAWDYYASFQPGADRHRSRDPNFLRAANAPTRFDWTPIDSEGLTTSIQQEGGNGSVSFSAPPSTGGKLLEQTQFLPPGSYRIEGRSMDIEQSENALPYWILACVDGRELGRVIIPNSAESNGNFSGRFSVPAGCPVQTLSLMARPSDEVAGLFGQITRLQLEAVR